MEFLPDFTRSKVSEILIVPDHLGPEATSSIDDGVDFRGATAALDEEGRGPCAPGGRAVSAICLSFV